MELSTFQLKDDGFCPDYKLTPMGYFLFLQEKRMTVRGWGNKTIAELQILCDPLWRALSKEEKAKYKHEKKRAKRMELDRAVKERQAQELMEKQAAELRRKQAEDLRKKQDLSTQALRMARGFMLLKKKTKIVLLEMITPSLAFVAPEIELDRVQKHLEKTPRTRIEESEVRKGSLGFCSYSKDGLMYRCEVLSSDRKKATVKFIDYGNEEEGVELDRIYKLPASLEKLDALCVKVKIGNMDGVKETEKNKGKVEKMLLVENLFVCLDIEGFATFFNDDIPINLRLTKSKSKEKQDSKGEFCLQKVEGQQEEAEERFVDEVIGATVKDDNQIPIKISKTQDSNKNFKEENNELNIACEETTEVNRVQNSIQRSEDRSLQICSGESKDEEKEYGPSQPGELMSDSIEGEEEIIEEEPMLQQDRGIEGTSAQVTTEDDGVRSSRAKFDELENIVEDLGSIEVSKTEESEDSDRDSLLRVVISQLPTVELEVLLTDSNLEVLESLMPELEPAQSEILESVVRRNLLTMASHSSVSARLVVSVMRNSSSTKRKEVLCVLSQSLELLLSSLPGFEVLMEALTVCSVQEVGILTARLTGSTRTVARARLGPYFLTEFVRRFPEISAVVVDEILQDFDEHKEATEMMEFFESLTSTKTGLAKVVTWITERLSDLPKDNVKAEFATKVIQKLEVQHEVEIETIWRSVMDKTLFLSLASSPCSSPLMISLVMAVVSGHCARGLTPEVLSVLARNVDVLTTTQQGIQVLKCIDGFI